jgi:hypothetical protein
MAVYGLAPAVGTGLAYMLGGTIFSKLGAVEWVALGPFGLVQPFRRGLPRADQGHARAAPEKAPVACEMEFTGSVPSTRHH